MAQGGWGTRWATATGTASGYSLGDGAFAVQGTSSTSEYARVFVSPPTGQSFAVGTYDISESATDTQARVQIDGGAPAECSTVSGTLTVHEVTLDAG